MTIGRSVSVTLKTDRLARFGEEEILLPANSVLAGQLVLELSDGPFGIREYEHSSFVRTCFNFTYAGRQMRHVGLVNQFHLWAPNGTQVSFEETKFISQCGLIDGMMDDRRDWSYIRPDGVRQTNRLKYTSCQFELMLETTAVQVKCRYYDQSPNIANYVTIYYLRDLDDLLLRKDIKFYYDQEGKVEDWLWDQGPYVTLVEPG